MLIFRAWATCDTTLANFEILMLWNVILILVFWEDGFFL